MKIIFVIVICLFLLKLLWNILIIWRLETHDVRIEDGQSNKVSLMPGIEVVLFLSLLALSNFISFEYRFLQTKELFYIGFGLIVMSYLFATIIGALARKKAKK